MQRQRSSTNTAALALLPALLGLACAEPRQSSQPAPGREESAETEVLEAGAALLQGSPLGRFDVYLVGFHPMKDDPTRQMEAHHFCEQVTEDFAQCVLLDANADDAKMNGVEYIISKHLFDQLPEEERSFWHPHNFEILSGQLVAPGLPDPAELELMEGKMNSYGKTFHFWHTGRAGEPGDPMPLGPPSLAWSFNRLGEARPELVERRDRAMDIDTEERRRERQELVELAQPQVGVDTLLGEFPWPTEPLEGVVDAESSPAEPGER